MQHALCKCNARDEPAKSISVVHVELLNFNETLAEGKVPKRSNLREGRKGEDV
jgi:hypothetical protein